MSTYSTICAPARAETLAGSSDGIGGARRAFYHARHVSADVQRVLERLGRHLALKIWLRLAIVRSELRLANGQSMSQTRVSAEHSERVRTRRANSGKETL